MRRLLLLVLGLLLLGAPPASAMKLDILKGTTCSNSTPRTCLVDLFIQDSSSTVGAGLTGLTSSTAGFTCYYARSDQGNAGGTPLSLSAGTKGTWSSGGFVEKDSTNMKGVYELGLSTAMLAAGSNFVLLYCSGATNLAPVVVEIALTNYDPQDGVSLGLSAVNANTVQWLGTPPTTPNVAGQPIVDLNRWRGAQPNILLSGRVDANAQLVGDKTGYALTQAFPANFAAQLITAAGVVTSGGVIRKNVGGQSYPILLVLGADHLTAATGKTVSVQVSQDGGAFAAIAGSVGELGQGWYTVTLAQADTNCTICAFVATATGADPRRFYFVTAP